MLSGFLGVFCFALFSSMSLLVFFLLLYKGKKGNESHTVLNREKGLLETPTSIYMGV